ncbi:MAG: hypothetical protein HY336_00965 [Candidatus Doudnabacteria bacterium]|nr:hypothetical protein [Candidatus Doudnabacteria bacterium]
MSRNNDKPFNESLASQLKSVFANGLPNEKRHHSEPESSDPQVIAPVSQVEEPAEKLAEAQQAPDVAQTEPKAKKLRKTKAETEREKLALLSSARGFFDEEEFQKLKALNLKQLKERVNQRFKKDQVRTQDAFEREDVLEPVRNMEAIQPLAVEAKKPEGIGYNEQIKKLWDKIRADTNKISDRERLYAINSLISAFRERLSDTGRKNGVAAGLSEDRRKYLEDMIKELETYRRHYETKVNAPLAEKKAKRFQKEFENAVKQAAEKAQERASKHPEPEELSEEEEGEEKIAAANRRWLGENKTQKLGDKRPAPVAAQESLVWVKNDKTDKRQKEELLIGELRELEFLIKNANKKQLEQIHALIESWKERAERDFGSITDPKTEQEMFLGAEYENVRDLIRKRREIAPDVPRVQAETAPVEKTDGRLERALERAFEDIEKLKEILESSKSPEDFAQTRLAIFHFAQKYEDQLKNLQLATRYIILSIEYANKEKELLGSGEEETQRRAVEAEIKNWGAELAKEFGVSIEAIQEVFGPRFAALIRGDSDVYKESVAGRQIESLKDAEAQIRQLKRRLIERVPEDKLRQVLGSAYEDLGLDLVEAKEEAGPAAWERARGIFAQLEHSYGIKIIEAPRSSASDNEKGAKLLEQVLPQFPPEKLRGKYFQPNNADLIYSDGMVAFNVDNPAEVLKDFLEKSLEKKIIVPMDELKRLIMAGIGGAARIENFELTSSKDKASVDAQFVYSGFKIKLQGEIRNNENNLDFSHIQSRASFLAQGRIKNALTRLPLEVKRFFESSYGKLSSIRIREGNLELIKE